MLTDQVGPIIAGLMAENLGWQSFWWLNVGILGFSSLVFIVLFPETRYIRSNALSSGDSKPSVSQRTNAPQDDKSNNPNNQRVWVINFDISERDIGVVSPVGSIQDTTMNSEKGAWLGRGKPSKQQWKLFQPYKGKFLMEMWLPWKLFLFPIVEFAAFVVSWSGSAYLTVNLTQTQAFAAPSYNFDSSKIGLFNLATLIGTWIGLLSAGPLSDAIAARLTKRNGGIREPE
jgi:MFS family permease